MPGREDQPALVAVLAGGAARRMGAPKALALLGGRPLVSYPLAAAAAAGLEAVVVAKPETALPDLSVPVWREPPTPQHPLLGLVTALEHAGRPVVAVACDQPWIPAELLWRLAAGDATARATALRVGDRLEPLPARYAPEALPVLHAALAAQSPLRGTLEALDPDVLEADDLRAFGDPARLVAGVNTPEALADAERQLVPASGTTHGSCVRRY